MTDGSAILLPLAGIQTTNFENPQTGRNFDYAPGIGARAEARLVTSSRTDLLDAGYGVVWARTADGTSTNNTLQFFRATVRLPITKTIGIGGRYSWYSRKTTYPGFFEARRTQSEWRAFVSLGFSRSGS